MHSRSNGLARSNLSARSGAREVKTPSATRGGLSGLAVGAMLLASGFVPCAANADDFTGPYIGTQFSYGTTDYNISDDNPNGGNNAYSHTRASENEVIPSIFAGYGLVQNDWYFGGEVEYTRPSTEYSGWERTGVNTFERKTEHLSSWAVDLRVGRKLGPASLVFARAGYVGGRFKDTLAGQGGISSYSESQTLHGVRFGFGSETSLGAGLKLRADYVYSHYNSMKFTTPANIKANYRPSTSLFRLGLAYHFNDADEVSAASAENFAGPYAGALLGYGSVGSQDGTEDSGHTQITLPGVSGGLVAGYGVTKGAFYLGAEGELGLGAQEFEDEFPQTGDKQEMKKTYALSVAGRLGYALTPKMMVYTKVGLTRAHFKSNLNMPNDTPARTGSDSADLNGVLVGVGSELLLDENYIVRLEYTHTAFERWDYIDSAGEHKFKPNENLVRVGMAYKF